MTIETLEQPHDLDPAHSEQDHLCVEALSEQVEAVLKKILEKEGLDTSNVLLRGMGSYKDWLPDPDADGMVHFASPEDMKAPSAEEQPDEEHREEAWMANPLRYAIDAGKLRVYLKKKVLELEHEEDDEFGTVIARASADDMRRAEVSFSAIDVIQAQDPVELSEEEYLRIADLKTDELDEGLRGTGIIVNSGIAKLKIVKSDGSFEEKFIDTSDRDFCAVPLHVVEVPRSAEQAERLLHAELLQEATEDLGEQAVEDVVVKEPVLVEDLEAQIHTEVNSAESEPVNDEEPLEPEVDKESGAPDDQQEVLNDALQGVREGLVALKQENDKNNLEVQGCISNVEYTLQDVEGIAKGLYISQWPNKSALEDLVHNVLPRLKRRMDSLTDGIADEGASLSRLEQPLQDGHGMVKGTFSEDPDALAKATSVFRFVDETRLDAHGQVKKAFHYSTDASQRLTDTLRVLTGILYSNSSWGNEHYAALLNAHVLTIREGLMAMRSSIHAITDRLDELDRKLR